MDTSTCTCRGETGNDVEPGLLVTLLRGEFDRLRQELAEAREAARVLDEQRRDLRVELESARLQAEHERESVRAMSDLVRANNQNAARLLAERDLARAIADTTASEVEARHAASKAALSDALASKAALSDALASAKATQSELAGQVERLESEAASLRAELQRRAANQVRNDRLPVLCRDLARWSFSPAARSPHAAPAPHAPRVVVVTVPVGPPPAPPSLDDLAAVGHLVETLRRLLAISPPNGKRLYTVFDGTRFPLLQAKLREAQLLGDRLVSQVERSRGDRDLIWNLMVARRTDEVQRRRR